MDVVLLLTITGSDDNHVIITNTFYKTLVIIIKMSKSMFNYKI